MPSKRRGSQRRKSRKRTPVRRRRASISVRRRRPTPARHNPCDCRRICPACGRYHRVVSAEPVEKDAEMADYSSHYAADNESSRLEVGSYLAEMATYYAKMAEYYA